MTTCAKTVSTGAMYELGARGSEETFTICKPESVLWSQCWKRHCNFAYAQVDFVFDQDTLTGAADWAEDTCVTAQAPRHGDLLIGTYMRANLGALRLDENVVPRASGVGDAQLHVGDEDLSLHWCEEVGNALIKEAEWLADNKRMDHLTSEVLHAYHEVNTDDSRLLGDAIGRQSRDTGTRPRLETFSAQDRYLYIPLRYSYMDHADNAFPLLAVSEAPITYRLTLRSRRNLIVALDTSLGPDIDNGAVDIKVANYASILGGSMVQAGMTNEMVFIDTPEQRAFTDQPIEKYYEFTQCLRSYNVAAGATELSVENMNFNNSITSLWVHFRADNRLRSGELEYFNYSVPLPFGLRPRRIDNGGATVAGGGLQRDVNPIACIEFDINSAVRLSRQGVYLHEVVPYLRHTRIASSYQMVYSFAQDNECLSHPSGALNIGLFSCVPLRVKFENTFTVSAEVPPNPGPYTAAVHTGLAESGKINVFARTQGFYKIAGRKISTRWLAN